MTSEIIRYQVWYDNGTGPTGVGWAMTTYTPGVTAEYAAKNFLPYYSTRYEPLRHLLGFRVSMVTSSEAAVKAAARRTGIPRDKWTYRDAEDSTEGWWANGDSVELRDPPAT